MKKISSLVLPAIFLVLMAACAPSTIQVTTPDITLQPSFPGSNPLVNQPDAFGRVAGTGTGIWHGIIAPVTLVLSFFATNVKMYEVHNTGSGYDLGFLIGQALVIALLSLVRRIGRRYTLKCVPI